MGMSSSQARLLSLTARQHDVELRAQKLQADKLQMANNSDQVYNKYMNALSATKIQTKVWDKWEGDTFKDATLAMLENGAIPNYTGGEVASTPLFLQEISSGRLMITPEYAASLGLNGADAGIGNMTLDEYLTDVEGLNKNSAPHGIKTEKPVYDVIEDTTKIEGFTGLAPTVNSYYAKTYYVTDAVRNSTAEAAISYSAFQKEITTVGGTQPLAGATVTANSGVTYSISSVADLVAFSQLTGSQTAGNTFVLTADINMAGQTSWTSMSGFAGTFNGNGHKIQNLTTQTNGLFTSTTTAAKIENLGLENITAKGTTDLGGIVGTNNGTISNCWLTGTVTQSSGSHVGGIVGTNNVNSAKIEYTNVNATITATGCCNGGVSGHNSGIIDHCNATGTINGGDTWTGGLVGHNNGTTVITNSSTNIYISSGQGGAIIGEGVVGSNLTIENVSYDPNLNPSLTITNSGNGGTTGIFKENLTVPIVNADGTGDFYANVYAAVLKSMEENGTLAEATDTEITNIQEQVKKYVLSVHNPNATLDDATKSAQLFNVANINEHIIEYLRNTPTDPTFITSLINDVNNGSAINTKDATYQNKYNNTNYVPMMSANNTGWDPLKSTNGSVTIPTKTVLANELYYAAQMSGKTISRDTINNFLDKYDTNDKTEMAYLVQLSDILYKASIGNSSGLNDNLWTAVTTGNVYTACGIPSYMDGKPENYTVNATGAAVVTPKYGTTTTQVDTEVTWDWNYDNAEVKAAIEKYNVLKAGYVIIGDNNNEEYEHVGAQNSTAWLTNVVNAGIAQFVKFDYEDFKAKISAPGADTSKIEMILTGTSVANETSIQEVADTEYVKRAEADYEAAMRKINRKETKIDTELSQLEAERTSIKTEQDGLKKIIQENVDLTFKLFS